MYFFYYYDLAFVVLHTIFALVTKQVTIKVATKVHTNLLRCKWYLTY